jgi:predicted DNA-binding WGR domain protein
MQQNADTAPLPCHIHLQAVDPTRNIARDYQIEASADLFGHWIIVVHWGRIGTRGQSRQLSFAEKREASRLIRSVLARRKGSKRRIGVAYRPVML